MTSKGQSPKLLDQMRGVLRLHRYALRTERAYCDWVRRYVKFHRMKSRDDLSDGKEKVEAFLTHLAVEGNVACFDSPERGCRIRVKSGGSCPR